jgi:hypothetical protein
MVPVNDGGVPHGGVVRILARQDDVRAREKDILIVGPFNHDYGIAFGSGVYPVLDLLERAFPRDAIARLRS